jgi:hypothetical protein
VGRGEAGRSVSVIGEGACDDDAILAEHQRLVVLDRVLILDGSDVPRRASTRPGRRRNGAEPPASFVARCCPQT